MSPEHTECPFCTLPPEKVRLQNELAYAIYDKNPITALHALIIPKRHTPDYFDLETPEVLACLELMRTFAKQIMNSDGAVSGFNIGVNAGRIAGQSIFHCHIHLIPRRQGDVGSPKGGLRHLIPGM
jgi:diadenosine tetraphosphate (Ap4A) HIT family hydrolase